MDYNDTAATRYYYDDLGNRSAVDDGTFIPYTSNALNQYTAVDSTNFSYDLNGNLIDTGQYKYTYDSENRLTDVNDQADLPIASFTYDTQGHRIEKTVYGSPNQITRTLYDGDQVIAEYDDNDTLLRRFIYGPGIDEPICMIDVAGGNQVYYYHFDGLGSVVALSDMNNQIVERMSYDVFGEPTIRDANGFQVSQSTIGNPYLFTGRRHDSETGLYYYRARYYAHDIGRFLQTDPIGYGDGIGWYGYCGNNPIGLVDPWGLWGIKKWEGHQELTYKAFRNAGYSHKDAMLAVDGSVATDIRNDHFPGRNDIPHYTPGDEAKASAHADGAVEIAIDLALKGENSASLKMLGMGMHTIQDQFAHSSQGAGWIAHGLGLLGLRGYPDDPHQNAELYGLALDASINYLSLFHGGLAHRNADLDGSGNIGNGYMWDIPTMRKNPIDSDIQRMFNKIKK